MIVRVAVIASIVSLLGAFLGMFLPIAIYEFTRGEMWELHNVFWESVFGFGLFIAGFFGSCMSDRWIGIVGLVAWPLVAVALIFVATSAILRCSSRVQIGWFCFLFVSLFVCVDRSGENYLSTHYVPLYWNLYASCY